MRIDERNFQSEELESMNIVIMNNDEDFIQFLAPELCEVVETIENGGLRTISVDYKFQDLVEDKRLFKIGNKIWIQNDNNLQDCLYIINTKVKQDIYNENSFTFEAEEVLVELNNAPVFTQTELTNDNGFTFSTNQNSNEYSVVVNWQALNYWFGEYFNIGVVQDCLSTYNQKINISGTVNLMNLLRQIEEETGNRFVTRYEKDILDNTIHRYLDFLNPISLEKNWNFFLEYDFLEEDDTIYIFDEDGNYITDDTEDVEDEDDIVIFDNENTNTPNLVPDDCIFKIQGSDELTWDGEDLPFNIAEYPNCLISLVKQADYLGLTVNYKTYTNGMVGGKGKAFTITYNNVTEENKRDPSLLKDDSYFEIINKETDKVIFRTKINNELGHVHEEVLYFGYNVENIELEFDESDTCTGVAPVLIASEEENGITRANMNTLINNWRSLEITKGEIIPMILEKVIVESRYYSTALASFGTITRQNYATRNFNPQDQLSADNPNSNKWEFIRGTSYYRAPFTKRAGEMHISTEANNDVTYDKVNLRPDRRDELETNNTSPKLANVETNETILFGIYNVCAEKLREHQNPNFEITVDVANLRDGKYNDYDLHDKVYIKIPDFNEILTARVVKTEKSLHDPGSNNITLDNYSIKNVKQIPSETMVEAPNVNFKYPNTSSITARLVNTDYNAQDTSTGAEYPSGKLLTFTILNVDENNNTELTTHTYSKVTNNEGKATLNLKGKPGEYKIQISFGGDEEYLDSTNTVEMSIGGTLPETKQKTTKTVNDKKIKQKTTKKTSTSKTKTLTTYYSKYGVSPDGKYLCAVGRPSASGELNKYGYKFYKTVFIRKCPMCGSTELYWSIFWGKSEKSNWGTFPATGRNESGSAEAQIFCKKCDADYSVFGNNHNPSHKGLKIHKKTVKSSKSEAYKLKKGKMVYESKKITVKQKKNTSTKTRTMTGTPSKYVQNLAKNIVGDSTGLSAAKKIAAWFGKKSNWKYEWYANFHRSPDKVLKTGRGNCCDTTRAMLTLMDAAGCTEKLTLKYVHVQSGSKGHVFARIIIKSNGNWCYVDPCKQYDGAWGHYVHGYGSPPGTQSTYPNLPF